MDDRFMVINNMLFGGKQGEVPAGIYITERWSWDQPETLKFYLPIFTCEDSNELVFFLTQWI